jgi:hypothetical protein
VRVYYYCNKAWLDWLASSSSILWCPKNPSNEPILFWASPNAVPILIGMIHLFTEFDEMLEIPRLYISACYYSVHCETSSNTYGYIVSPLQTAY